VSARVARASFEALGTTAVVATADPAALDRAELLLRHELEAIDRACSRFRDDSELTTLNRRAGEVTRVGPLLMEALRVALDAAAATAGAVDPTVGRAIGALGYDRDFSLVGVEGAARRVRAQPVPGWRAVRIDPAGGWVLVPRGVSIDLGATAKALAADRAAHAISAALRAGVLVSLGGDVAVAGPPPDGGWTVFVTDDHRHGPGDADGQTVAIRDGGLATSSTTVRRWRAGHAERHHIVDPSSGRPAEVVWRTVTVAAPSCVRANVASTAAIVGGRTAPEWLRRAGLPARLVDRDGLVTRVCRWPEPRP
jgi:thiamine biosynthesis lipoprotein ApbE